jgi:hypothetical protein
MSGMADGYSDGDGGGNHTTGIGARSAGFAKTAVPVLR